MKRTIIIIFCMTFIFQACTKQLEMKDSYNLSDENLSTIVPLEKALETLDTFLSGAYSDQTRNETRRIKSIDTYAGDYATKSGEVVPQAYVINYDNNEGFAILGANTDVFPIVAVTENGQIDPETLLVEDESGIVDREFLADYIKGSINYKESPEDTTKSDHTRAGSRANVLPLLNQKYTFDQTSSYCHDSNGRFAKCGCGATALSIIVAYNGNPNMNVTTMSGVEQINYAHVDSIDGSGRSFTFYDNNTVDAKIYINPDDYYYVSNFRHNTNNPDSIAMGTPLAYHISDYPLGFGTTGKYCCFNYNNNFFRTRSLLQAALFYRINVTAGFISTSASADDMIECLENMNYQNVSKRNAYSITNNMLNDIEDMLTNGKPAIIGGRPLINLHNKGHVWVVDGEYNLAVINTFALHFNWGWGGRCNGYFAPSSSINSASAVMSQYDHNNLDNTYSQNFGHFTTIRYDLPSYTYTFSNPLSVHYQSFFNPYN